MIHSTVACFDVTKKSDYVTFSDEMGQKGAVQKAIRANNRCPIKLFRRIKLKADPVRWNQSYIVALFYPNKTEVPMSKNAPLFGRTRR
jgi:hypothetical protein